MSKCILRCVGTVGEGGGGEEETRLLTRHCRGLVANSVAVLKSQLKLCNQKILIAIIDCRSPKIRF